MLLRPMPPVSLLTLGDISALAGVYTMSFLAVMALFAIGNIPLKVKRSNLPRPTIAPWSSVFLAIAGVLIGLIGNAVRNPQYLEVFLWYFVPTMLVVGVMLYRIPLLRLCLYGVRTTSAVPIVPLRRAAKNVESKIVEFNSQ